MTEANKLACPKCDGILVYTSDGYLVCTQCDYRRSVVKRVPTQAELLEEIERLKDEVEFYKKRWRETTRE